MAVAANFLLVHIAEQEILGFGELFGKPPVDVAEIARKRTHVVEVIFRPPRKVRATQLALRPGDAERRCICALALDRGFEGCPEGSGIHELGHASTPRLGAAI
jgi:hypothetical protein